jgi:predicted AlkP superfamily phosphohydrolase/phosphomutase
MSANQSRTLIIGLDGATFDIIQPLAQAGYLPTLARLMEQGAHGPLQAWPNTNSAAAWSSMVTGYNAGQHGIYHFGEALIRRGAPWRPTTGADRRKDPFWRHLSAAHQYVGIINMPISYPADAVNGFMLAGMDTPSLRSSGFAHPPDLPAELRRQGIEYVIDVPTLGEASRRDPHRLPALVHRMIDARARTILYLMDTRPWDVLLAVFVATDRVQHYFWPDEGSAVDAPEWTPIRSVYQQIDAFLGQALARLDETATVLVVSDHGFGPAHAAKRHLNELFAHLGWLCFRQGKGDLQGWVLKNLLRHGRRFLPHSLQNWLAHALPGLHLRAVSQNRFSGVDWSKTHVYADLPGSTVYINLRGREEEGVVPPEEYHAWCERVRDVLLQLTDPATGRRAIRAVRRREEIYHGPFLEQAPDLRLEWDYEVPGDALCYAAGAGPIIVTPREQIQPGSQWNGTHRSDGIFIAHGPSIRRGAVVDNVAIYDIAPTVLYLQNQPVLTDMDGKVLIDIFVEEHLRRHPIRWKEPKDTVTQVRTDVLAAEEAREVEERLRSLGYLE